VEEAREQLQVQRFTLARARIGMQQPCARDQHAEGRLAVRRNAPLTPVAHEDQIAGDAVESRRRRDARNQPPIEDATHRVDHRLPLGRDREIGRFGGLETNSEGERRALNRGNGQPRIGSRRSRGRQCGLKGIDLAPRRIDRAGHEAEDRRGLCLERSAFGRELALRLRNLEGEWGNDVFTRDGTDLVHRNVGDRGRRKEHPGEQREQER
jgi:hypothetical protein